MKTIKPKLIFLGLLLIISTIVIGELRIRSLTMPILWVYFPFFIYSLLDKTKLKLLKSLILLFLTGYSLFALLAVFRFVMCGSGSSSDWYVNRANENLKIVGFDYSCLGTTGDLVLYKQFAVLKTIKFEIYYKTFEDFKNITIDTVKWKPIR